MADTMIVVSREDLRKMVEGVASEAVERVLSRLAEEKKDGKVVSKKEIIKTYGVSDTTLWRLKKNGVLSPIKVGGKVCYNLAEVERVMKGGVKV